MAMVRNFEIMSEKFNIESEIKYKFFTKIK
jgi:hypothetical protein